MEDDAPIWLFDSVCVLCDNSVQFTLRHEQSPSIQFVSIQSDPGRKIARQNDIDPDNPQSFLFIENDKVYAKSDGVLALANHLRYPARILKIGKIVPKFLRDWAYDLVARNRYKTFGRHDNCIIPSPKTRHRFILQDHSQ